MQAVAEIDDATEKHPVTPGAILPAREQLGELFLEVGRPAEALVAFEASLRRAPRQLASLYGAAHSAKLSGDTAKAGKFYALADVTRASDGGRAEIREARANCQGRRPLKGCCRKLTDAAVKLAAWLE